MKAVKDKKTFRNNFIPIVVFNYDKYKNNKIYTQIIHDEYFSLVR